MFAVFQIAALVAIAGRSFAHPHESRAATISPLKLIDDSIAALGGQNALASLNEIIYESAE